MESMEARFRTHQQRTNSCCLFVVGECLFWALLPSPEFRVPRPGSSGPRPDRLEFCGRARLFLTLLLRTVR